MARFDVYRFSSKAAPLVVDVQSEVLDGLASRVVIPLVPTEQSLREALPRLKPRITVNNKDYILMTTDLSALPRSRLGPWVGNIDTTHHDDITDALDFLFFGF